jgi:transcriptional regulator with XRE-family HTH domain
MSITLKELGERIRLLRGERSQAAIAAKAGIAQGYWSEIERGEKVPKLYENGGERKSPENRFIRSLGFDS